MKKIKVIILTTILVLLTCLSFGISSIYMKFENDKISDNNEIAAKTCYDYGSVSDCNNHGCEWNYSTGCKPKQVYNAPQDGCYTCSSGNKYYNKGTSIGTDCQWKGPTCSTTPTKPTSCYNIGDATSCTTSQLGCEWNYSTGCKPKTSTTTTKPNSIIYVTIDPNGGEVTSSYFGLSNRTSAFQFQFVRDGNLNLDYFQISKSKDGYTFSGWGPDSNCSSGVTGNYYLSSDGGISNRSSKEVNYVFYACWKKNGSTPTPTTPITQPTTPSTTTTKNAHFYARNKEYSGETINCGDRIYVTTCTGGNNSICTVTVINGRSVNTTTKIYETNIVSTFSGTGCSNNERYIKEKTYYYSNREMTNGKTEINCGSIITTINSLGDSCQNGICEVKYNNQNIYVKLEDIVSYKPICNDNNKCESSSKITNAKKNTTIKICNSDSSENFINNIFTCEEGYQKDYKLVETKDDYKVYEFRCDYLKRPSLSASGGTVNNSGIGTIKFTATDNGGYGLKGYFISNGESPSVTSSWKNFSNNSYSESVDKTAGTYFVWAMNQKNRISYPIMTKIYDGDLSNTLKTFKVTDATGKEINVSKLDDGTLSYEKGIVDQEYALLSNSLLNDSSLALFDQLSTGYELTVNSNKIAIYATLTENDASYVAGYEPRTVDLNYGRNVVLIKIINKKGKERTYTFIVNRVDDRSNNNLLSNLTLSKGKINFDPYVTDYTVTIPSNTEKVSINAELQTAESAFVSGYEPREIKITSDTVSAVIKTISASGSVRSYVITFIRNGSDEEDSDSAYLSSLTIPGTSIGFDKKTYNYNVSVEYEVEDIAVYAFAESENAKVTVSETTGLKVGTNLIEITVTNGSKIKVYTLHVIRKSSGLEVSDDTKLGSLSIKGYDIDFDPEILDYKLKIKYDKSLLITATPASNRSDVYMYGNNDLTGFSTVRVKVIAENGKTLIYSIDIEKDAYNKTLEIIAASVGGLIIISTAIIIVIKKRKKKLKEYMEV